MKTKASVSVWQKVAIADEIPVLSSHSGERDADHGKKAERYQEVWCKSVIANTVPCGCVFTTCISFPGIDG